MFNDDIKTKALAEYQKAVKDYTSVFETLKAEQTINKKQFKQWDSMFLTYLKV